MPFNQKEEASYSNIDTFALTPGQHLDRFEDSLISLWIWTFISIRFTFSPKDQRKKRKTEYISAPWSLLWNRVMAAMFVCFLFFFKKSLAFKCFLYFLMFLEGFMD